MTVERIRQTLWSQGFAFYKVVQNGEMKMLACAVLDRPSQTIHLGAGATPMAALRNALEDFAGTTDFALTPEVVAALPSIEDIPDILADPVH